MVDRDSVELEAKGQASAQRTTGTVTCGANKKKNKVTWIVGHFENLRILRILGILRILRSLNIF